ncbi:MAG: alpha/beta hydrolase fold domain-containing protein [Pseudomonadales bacterium]
MNSKHLPGRLGDPASTLLGDRRLDPRIAAALEVAGELAAGVEPVAPGASYEACLDYCRAFETSAAAAHPLMEAAMPTFEGVVVTTETIRGVDGNDITLYVHAPKNRHGAAPCVVHTHGGGMVLMTAADPGFVRWRSSLAEAGLVVVGVEFRNGAGCLGNHPFPAGLEDCASAVKWTHEHRDALGISAIVISGESGGGNLALATTLKARREGWLEHIDGAYAMCPYISGAYADPPGHLLSLRENDGYTLDCQMMTAMVKVYDPEGRHGGNPLAWPYQAAIEDLSGLPPHVISVNELDPLRDEGLEYYRKLVRAGNSAVARTVHGTNHAGDLMLPDVTPDLYQETLRSLCGFARSLERG